PKCMFTMACLHVCDALDAAPQFPLPLDLEAIHGMRLPLLKHRVDWALMATISDDRSGGALRDAARAARQNAVRHAPPEIPGEHGPLWIEETSFGRRWLNRSLALMLEGVARPPVTPK